MFCQNCHEREANVHVSKMINGQLKELYLCEQCAKKTQEINFVIHPGLIVPDFLQALFGFNAAQQELRPEEACPKCGMTPSGISRAGKLGCSTCYDKFEAQLEPLLRRIHGGGQHVGKVPLRRGVALKGKLELKKLKEKLQILIQQEKFEEAAFVRDKIKELEQNMGRQENEAQ